MKRVDFLFLIISLFALAVFTFSTAKPSYNTGKSGYNTSGFQSPGPHKGGDYEFRVATSEESESLSFMGAQICHIYDFSDYEHDLAIAYGQMRSLFGEPAYTTEDLENLYEYNIIATDKKGNKVLLYVYNGPTGPAIGGDTSDPEAEAAAKELVKVIQCAEPVDFYCEAYYLDGPVKVTIEVKNGKGSVTEVPIDEKELEDVFNKLYGDDL